MPKLPQLADLVQTMAQLRVSNTAQDAALVLCLRQHLSSSLGGGAFKGEKSTDPDFLVSHYENFLQQLFSLTLRPSSKQLARTVLKAHDGIDGNDAREWAKKMCFLTTYIRSKGYRISTGARTEPSVVRLSQTLQTSETGSAVTLPLQNCVLWKGASKLKSPQKQKAKTPQKEMAVAGSQKRMTASEGAAASKRQNILAAWGAETVESSQGSDQFVDVLSSEESQKDAEKTEDSASSFFDQHQCSMVVVDTKGCHHVCTTSAGEHGFLEVSFQGLQRTTEIPNLALKSVQDSAFKRPASVAKSVAKAKAAVSKKPATQAKSGAKAKSCGSKGNSMKEPSPAEIAPDDHEIVSASPSTVPQTYKLEHYKVTKTRKYASLGLRREFGDKKQIWSRPRRTTWGYAHVFPHAPTLAHHEACHRQTKEGICTRPTVHTKGSRPKCVG